MSSTVPHMELAQNSQVGGGSSPLRKLNLLLATSHNPSSNPVSIASYDSPSGVRYHFLAKYLPPNPYDRAPTSCGWVFEISASTLEGTLSVRLAAPTIVGSRLTMDPKDPILKTRNKSVIKYTKVDKLDPDGVYQDLLKAIPHLISILWRQLYSVATRTQLQDFVFDNAHSDLEYSLQIQDAKLRLSLAANPDPTIAAMAIDLYSTQISDSLVLDSLNLIAQDSLTACSMALQDAQ